jgi:hypothetical protein
MCRTGLFTKIAALLPQVYWVPMSPSDFPASIHAQAGCREKLPDSRKIPGIGGLSQKLLFHELKLQRFPVKNPGKPCQS